MKSCPHCQISVGGSGEYCPLCQNPLAGEGEPPRYPDILPALRRQSMLYKIITFLALASAFVCLMVDFTLTPDLLPFHWSIIVVVLAVAALVLLRALFKRRYNAPKLLFQILLGASLIVVFLDSFTGYQGYSVDVVVPVLCCVTLLLNFLCAFLRVRLTENGLVYLLLNIVVGVCPYLLYFFRDDEPSLAWSVCLIISVLTFLGLVVFKGRVFASELEKRLHM